MRTAFTYGLVFGIGIATGIAIVRWQDFLSEVRSW